MQLLRLPSLGETMEWGIVTQWFKREGDRFEVGDDLYEVENEKSTLPVEAMTEGIVVKHVAPLGEELAVGTVVAVIADAGEEVAEDEIAAALAADPGTTSTTPDPAKVEQDAPRPRSRRDPRRIRAVPKARALARDLGIDLATITGTGRDGMVTVDDIDAAALAVPVSAAQPAIRERRKVSGVPKAMARSMAQSWAQIPHFTQTAVVDGRGLLGRRNDQENVSINDLVVASVIAAAVEVPEVNASFQGDVLVVFEDVNVSVAVATEHGLVAPVVHEAQTLDIDALSGEISRLSAAAHDRSLTPDDLAGGTITVSNLGMYGVDFGTPVVTHPQAAIVFAGALKERPVVVHGEVVARPTLHMTVAFDHRAVDGAAGARFLDSLRGHLERR